MSLIKAALRSSRRRVARVSEDIPRVLWQGATRYSTQMAAPFLSHEIPNSLLKDSALEAELYAGKRKRISTCSGVAWIPKTDRFVTINMHNSVLNGFALDTSGGSASSDKLVHLWELDSKESMGLHRTENIAFSSSLRLMALSNTGTGLVQFFDTSEISNERLATDLEPIFTLGDFPDRSLHGISFDSSGELLCVTTTAPGSTNVYKVERTRESGLHVNLLQRLSNPRTPLRPKDARFSPCGRWVAIGYTMRIGTQVGRSTGSISIHAWDEVQAKVVEAPVDEFRRLNNVETLAWTHDGVIYATDQLSDQITMHQLDLTTGSFVRHGIFSGGKTGRLSLPHGICLSPDDRFLVTTNYGTDSVSVFDLNSH